ncbi:MAG: hybrid sensor histidine kinase/response regulator [Thermodesulfobacteriota bacterium]
MYWPTARLIFNISGSNGLGGRLPIPFDKDELTNVHLRRPDGTDFFGELQAVDTTWAAKPAYLITIRDMTVRKKAQKALQNRNARLRSIFRTSPVGIGMLRVEQKDNEIENRRIYEANDRLCEMLGYHRDEIEGAEVEKFYFTKAEYERVGRELYAQIARSGIGRIETRWRCKDGTPIELLLNAAPVNAHKWAEGISFTILDITQHKKTEAERQKLESQLRHAQKMEAVGQLAGGVAHDFNNLLQIINGYADLLQQDMADASPERQNLQQIIQAGEKAAGLVHQLLAFSRRQILQMQRLDLNALIDGISDQIRQTLGADILFRFIPDRQLAPIWADPGQIEEVLMHLCANARDAMPEGGDLRIETRNINIDAEKGDEELLPGRYARLTIVDTGCGMDAETAAQAFEPFFTTKAVDRGTGLGLATVYGIVKQHHGNIEVFSKPAAGTRFHIYLPIIEVQPTTAHESENIDGETGHETILVAEDDRMVRHLIERILQRAGFQVLSAGDGPQAIETYKAHAEMIDLALLDVVMPGCSGRIVHDAIKQINPAARVLFSSGYNREEIHTNFVLHEDAQLLQKPFASGELLEKVRKVLSDRV